MMTIKTLSLLILFTFSINAYSQIISSNDKFGNLQFIGNINTENKSNYDLSECISTSAMIMGIESKTESKEAAIESSFVKGEYSYSYYVNDYEASAGEVQFKFEYTIKKGAIAYKLYDFEHLKSDSEFESIGILPNEWNEKVKASFTKKQYAEIMTDLRLNVANAIRMINKYCTK
ncbi:hypothetical protein [uncultured Lacinutrix sp.]|uniref:hypothetical protein n=1 Tax=uncultured Lacinutrix sp. TaxID=574032 RepID=UPI00261A80C3|nr:hypothetical protein [uncultured Lacinutrix sp.]